MSRTQKITAHKGSALASWRGRWASKFENISLFVQLIRDAIDRKAVWEIFREQVFFNKVVIPLTLDLTTLNDQQDPFHDTEYQFVELNLEDVRAGKFPFSIHTRYIKALRRLKRGLRGFALLKDSTIRGDIWCVAPCNRITPGCPDFEKLGIYPTDGDAFGATMFIDPAYRGKKLAAPFLLSLDLKLKREGWRRYYASTFEDNIPSRWLHFKLKFKELPNFREFRFFTIKSFKRIPTDPSNKRTC